MSLAPLDSLQLSVLADQLQVQVTELHWVMELRHPQILKVHIHLNLAPPVPLNLSEVSF